MTNNGNRMLDNIKKFDTFSKTIEDAQIRTISGAAISIISFALIIILIFLEFNAYVTPTIQEELFVDTTRSHKLQINFDFFVPKISCDYLALDAQDSTGDQHIHIEHNVFKRRMEFNGRPIDEAKKEDITTKKLNSTSTSTPTSAMAEVKCGSCYGAEQNSTHCCKTCQDVLDAYREKKWNYQMKQFEQCATLEEEEKEKVQYALKEACQIYGKIEVNRMSGSFHLAPGKSFSINHIHVHDVQPFASKSFNTSHKINHLSFGEKIDYGSATHPLDGFEATADEGGKMFQYYIKIVPTMYVFLNGSILHTNQYSVTTYQKLVSAERGDSGMPGIFFSYELSPLMVKISEKSNSLGHFLTSVCGIVGGIYVVASIIDSFLHSSIRVIKKKVELGKFS